MRLTKGFPARHKGSNHVVVTVFIMGTPEAKAKAIGEKVMRKALTRL